ncbi:ATP-dependent DNA helicase DinG [Teredinibacter haidensis]|mgnify:CR=1 FL=1|uniref:ATP-dependent DNA helicase DinG n=1 Tax=Teredinibacter haidensis TaxID=2731755 RepID=UPI000948F9C7|nr:ATP-dependent DNA helicase DinG [Teredinibacter haidensis]
MLDTNTKEVIQQAYSKFLAAKELKPRYGQKLMIAEIARTLGNILLDDNEDRASDSHICVIEAGTGVGKTVAYLLAALPIAKALNKRLVLATATVALQEQVVLKDLPELLRFSELNFQFRLAKGRGRYLCLAKLDKLLSAEEDTQFIPLYEDEQSGITSDESRLYGTMMEKLSHGHWDGDRDNWDDEIQQSSWQRVTTDHRQCTGRKCSFVRSCSFFKARDELDDVDCVVANHDLVLADLALGGGAILSKPEETIYIFDEGHHLPEKALNHFASHTRYRSTIRWLGQSEGQWPSIVEPIAEASYFMQLTAPMESTLKNVRTILEQNLHLIQALTEGVDREQFSPRLRFPEGVVPPELETLASELQRAFAELVHLLEKLNKEMNLLIDEDYPTVPRVDLENVLPILGSWLSRAEGNLELWTSYADTRVDKKFPLARWINLLEFNEVSDFEIVASPILASRALRKDLWSRCFGAVVTSATLTALNKFDRFQYRAGTYDDSRYVVVPSPFDYPNNADLVVPDGALEANDALAHTDSIIELLPEIIDENAGSLVLFSSRKQMQEVYEELPRDFKIIILMQGLESKQALVRKHKKRIDNGQGSIIFGLASFAEGVDLPGDYCTHVVIAKIPFSVPDDPIEAALAEWIEAGGGNAFMEITVPDAAIKLVQSCGRLLRTESDTGRVSILDKRLKTKRYGKALLNSLPPFGGGLR